MGRQVLVTGGSGYIGSHTVVELQAVGFDVVIIDDLSNSSSDVVDNIEKISGIRPAFEVFNLLDLDKLEAFFEKYTGIEAIIHFAAFKAVGESVQKPLAYYRNNLVSLMNILDCMTKYNIPNLVFSSSCTVYGQPDQLPVTENTPKKDAESPYGNTKAISEEVLRDVVKVTPGIKVIALRYFNPIGAHPSALIGELPSGVPGNLVPFMTQTAAGIRQELSVFGNDYNTPDGSCIRDYINVVDLAKAHVISIDRLINKKETDPFEFFNIGTGTGASVLEVVNTFEKSTGVKLNFKIVARRPGDVEKIYADTTIANTVLGWKAETSLSDTLISAWNWEKRIRNIE
jgi:UDP-glucose 4-epimerase